jgi:alpha-acetolactate decarboxylase
MIHQFDGVVLREHPDKRGAGVDVKIDSSAISGGTSPLIHLSALYEQFIQTSQLKIQEVFGTMADRLYQYSTASALMAGVASTGIPLSNLLKHGTHGLGTMAAINGEVIILDSTTYHLQSSGAVRVVEPHEQLPFAMVTSFNDCKTRTQSTFPGLPNKQSILQYLQSLFHGINNRFAFFLIPHIHLDTITARVVRGQQYPRQPLSELGEAQKVNTYESVTGTIVGFWSPAYMDGVSVSGLHMHFLSEDRSDGGHVLEMRSASEFELQAALLNEFDLELADNEEFGDAGLGVGGEALKKVEG